MEKEMKTKIPSHILFTISVLIFAIVVTINDYIAYSKIQRNISLNIDNRPKISSVCGVSSEEDNWKAYICTGYDLIPVEITRTQIKPNFVIATTKNGKVFHTFWILADSKYHPGHHFSDRDFGIGNEIIVNMKSGSYRFVVIQKDRWKTEEDNHKKIYIGESGERLSESEFIMRYNKVSSMTIETKTYNGIVVLYSRRKQ